MRGGRQTQKQILFEDDNKKGKGKGKGNDNGNGNGKGSDKGKYRDPSTALGMTTH